MKTCLPENFKVAQLASPETTNGGKTSDYINLKNCHRATIVIDLTQAVGHATAFSLMKATAVAPTGATAVTATVPIWANEDCGGTDTLVAQTDAASFTVAADVKDKQIIFQIDPELLGATYDCVAAKSADSSQATNFWNATAILEYRHQRSTPPTAITD